MNNKFLISSILIGVFISLVSFSIGYNNGYQAGEVSCVNSADILHSDTNDIMSLYIPGDIAHIYFAYNEVYFEQGGDPLQFNSREEMYDYIGELTAYNSSIHGYKESLDWLVAQGYIYARTIYNDDEKYTELIYDGPNWTVNAEQDTSYIISTFNNVEKIYNPKTKSIEYDSYTVD